MKARFQADNDFNQRVVKAVLRLESAIDFKTAPAAGFHHGTPDPTVLEMAAAEGRILVSYDRKTMPMHFAEFIQQHQSPGLIVVSRKLSIRQAADWIHTIWGASEAEEYINSIAALP